MAKTKKIKYKKADGTLSDYIAIGADASNIDLNEGISLEELNTQLVRLQGTSILKDSQGKIIYPQTEIENVADINGKPLFQYLKSATIQYEEMPQASISYEGKIIQYVGEEVGTDLEFQTGHFYQCQGYYEVEASTGEGSWRYKWGDIEVQSSSQQFTFDETPTEGSSNPVTSDGIKNYVDDAIVDIDLTNYYTKTETDNLLNNISVDLSNYYNKQEIDEKIGDIESLLASI